MSIGSTPQPNNLPGGLYQAPQIQANPGSYQSLDTIRFQLSQSGGINNARSFNRETLERGQFAASWDKKLQYVPDLLKTGNANIDKLSNVGFGSLDFGKGVITGVTGSTFRGLIYGTGLSAILNGLYFLFLNRSAAMELFQAKSLGQVFSKSKPLILPLLLLSGLSYGGAMAASWLMEGRKQIRKFKNMLQGNPVT